jgi:hypothetical protein
MNAIQAFVPSEIVKTFAAFLNFCYIARRNIITDDSLEQLNVALHNFHESRQVFSGTVRGDGLSGFSLPRQHAMVHYYDHIKNFGSPNGLCSSITESKHIAAVKRPWRRSNKHAALPQMLKVNERLDKLAAARADFAARGMLVDSCLIQAIKDISNTTTHDGEDPMDEDASDSGESDSDIFDEIRIFGSNRTNTRDFDHTTSELDDISTHGLNDTNDNTNTNALDDPNAHVTGAGDNHPRTPRQHSPAPPEDEEDDDHGPVESGPLMNEVRLASRKG